MTMTLAPTNTNATVPTDAELISLSRAGDRRAFGQIVRRYQAMISGLIYAACGDLHRSEDVAQDTFISAWKSLSGLRDAAKLPGWLCQIARRRLADKVRTASASEIQFSQAFEAGQEPAAPESEAVSAEESELLWRTLARIPQPYRETLVLYYRQEKSTAQVAAAMETSEASVRQRLTRGREMLREEVAAALERNLVRTSPSAQFTQQVVAALPALAAQGAGIGAGAKAAAAVKGATFLSVVVGWLMPISFFGGLIFGTVQEVRQSQTLRQRRLSKLLVSLLWGVIVIYIVAMNVFVRVADGAHWDLASKVDGIAVIGCIFGMTLYGQSVIGRWRMMRILREEGIVEPPFPTLALWKRLAFTLPLIAVSLGWLIRLAIVGGDQISVNIMMGWIVVQGVWLAWRVPQLQPDRPIQQTFETFVPALVVTFIMLNWKLQEWIASGYGLHISDMPAVLPMWGVNLATLVLFAWVVGLRVLTRMRKVE